MQRVAADIAASEQRIMHGVEQQIAATMRRWCVFPPFPFSLSLSLSTIN
jgi:hypothetical protein